MVGQAKQAFTGDARRRNKSGKQRDATAPIGAQRLQPTFEYIATFFPYPLKMENAPDNICWGRDRSSAFFGPVPGSSRVETLHTAVRIFIWAL